MRILLLAVLASSSLALFPATASAQASERRRRDCHLLVAVIELLDDPGRRA